MNTFESVRKIIAFCLGMEEDEISLESNLIDDLGADSLDAVDISMSLEEEFDVEISDDEVENFKTVEDIVKYIESIGK